VRIHLGDDALQVLKFCLVLTVSSIPLATPTVLGNLWTNGVRSAAVSRKSSFGPELPLRSFFDDLDPHIQSLWACF
jgi:hypothetical protein